MAIEIVYTPIFIRKARSLKKKHYSLIDDLQQLEQSLIADPKQGVNLGSGLYKLRLAISSKGKGKSGGYRIITYLINQSNDNIVVNMLTLYDKSEDSSIDKQHLLKLIKELF